MPPPPAGPTGERLSRRCHAVSRPATSSPLFAPAAGDGTVKITLSVTSAVLTTPPGPAGKLTGVVIGQHRGRKVRLLSERPRIVLIDGFLSRDECHDMRRTASPHLQASAARVPQPAAPPASRAHLVGPGAPAIAPPQ